MTADRPQGRPLGRAGAGPSGPAGRRPGQTIRWNDTIAGCGCDNEAHALEENCPCFTHHHTGICACCRLGRHDESCRA